VLGPPIDAFACEGEAVAAAVHQAGHPAIAATVDGAPDVHGTLGACVHGVCVHAPCDLPASAPACLAPGHEAEVHGLAQAAAVRSAVPSGLKRPPRA
jgi:hypothetical protein